MTRPSDDPFGERKRPLLRARLSVLGGDFLVETADTALLRLTVDAFGGLPKYRLGSKPQRFGVRLVSSTQRRTWPRGTDPPLPTLSAGAGLLCASLDAGNFTVVDVDNSRALVSISSGLLRYPYHARNDLVELAFLTLASRAQRLVPLHGACVGANGAGLLLVGDSGTGKSTLSLHALARGMKLLSEDSAFVAMEGMRVIGAPNFLHVQPSALDSLEPGHLRRAIEAAPMIRRRSGVRKLEVDLRNLGSGAARSPLTLAATVVLSRRSAGTQPALKPIDRRSFIARLRREQPYASGLRDWHDFESRVAGIPAYELRRTSHPDEAVDVLRGLLDA